jgi:phospho-N-acetylmuramoyl-pentapeptide-transferase
VLYTLLQDTLASPVLRAAIAAIVSGITVLFAVPALAKLARRRRFVDRDGKSDSETLNKLHEQKRGTPYVGGIAMTAGALLGSLSLMDVSSEPAWVLLATLILLSSLGFVDDVTKTFGRKKTQGLSARQKLAGQVLLGLAVGGVLVWRAPTWGLELGTLTSLSLPFTSLAVPVGVLGFLGLTTLVVTGSSNAVNLTDGLDGLAGGCALVALGVFETAAQLAGSATLAADYGLVHVPGAGEAGVVLAAIAGGVAAFLVFNKPPAKVFMGDTGSLALGGVLAAAAVLTKQELLLALVGGVFVAEALSVMIQVGSFKLTGKRVFRCAPLHHHFEFAGWKEPQVVTGFHTAALICAAVGLVALGIG